MGKAGFSWKRALGITKAKQNFSRKTGIPLTKAGRERKIGKALTGGCLVYVIVALLTICFGVTVFAHPGRLDKNSGHNKTADGTYHYHLGDDRSTEYKTKPTTTAPTAPTKTTPATPPASAPTAPTTVAPTILPAVEPSAPTQPTAIVDPAQVQEIVIQVFVDGEKVEFEQHPINHNGNVMVPIRHVVEKMGCAVSWDSDTQTVYINEESAPLEKTAIKTDNINVYVNNEPVLFPVQQPINLNGRILIPVRYVAEKLNYSVSWDGSNHSVLINSVE